MYSKVFSKKSKSKNGENEDSTSERRHNPEMSQIAVPTSFPNSMVSPPLPSYTSSRPPLPSTARTNPSNPFRPSRGSPPALFSKIEPSSSRPAGHIFVPDAPFPSIAPSTARSVFNKPEDLEMASRQSKYATLAAHEQQKQDTWVQREIFDHKRVPCPEGFGWSRIRPESGVQDGYQCLGGTHLCTDQQVAEGKQGLFMAPEGKPGEDPRYTSDKQPRDDIGYGKDRYGNVLKVRDGRNLVNRGETDIRWGPYYPHHKNKNVWCFAGAGVPEDEPTTIVSDGTRLGDVQRDELYLEFRRANRLTTRVHMAKTTFGDYFGGPGYWNEVGWRGS